MMLLGLGVAVAWKPGNAQALDSSLTIRVESRRVLVPVTLSGAVSCEHSDRRDQYICSWDGERIKVADKKVVAPFDGFDLGFDSIKNLRILEDGKEQKIESIETITAADNGVRHDNLGVHSEWGDIPKGLWSTSDQDSRLFAGSFPRSYYEIAYIPPSSSEGSCHSIRLKIERHESRLVYRHQYCNVNHGSSDPLRGTPDDRRLSEYVVSNRGGGIHLSAKATYFYAFPERILVRIDVELPFNDVKAKKWSDFNAPFDLLIIADRNGDVVARHSDHWWDPDDHGLAEMGYSVSQSSARFTPTRYDAEVELPPGKYKVAIAVSHGPKKFGVTEVPLTIDPYDEKQLAISSVALCKRVRKAGDIHVAADLLPLVSNGFEFTPAADTVFHKGESLMVYFELYEPSASAPQPNSSVAAQGSGAPVKFQMRIVNATTGAVEMKTEMSALQWMQPGKSSIPIVLKPELDKLAAGKYRVEVQASDSAGKSTAWRAAEMSIE